MRKLVGGIALGSLTLLASCHGSPPPVKADAKTVVASKGQTVGVVPRPLPPPSEPAAVTSTRPRLLLTKERLERARTSALGGSNLFRELESACTNARKRLQGSGYQGWDWGHLVARCAIVWHATKKHEHAETALIYLRALLDDRRVVGDRQGGEKVVQHDHGYPIRTHAFYAALGYDWLYHAPGMIPELRAKIIDRLDAWLRWYGEYGYQRNKPVSNYFTGYFLALSFAGMATAGDDPRGDAMLAQAEATFEELVAPRYRKILAGGDWPEGWQYGDGAVVAMALFVDGQRTSRNKDRIPEIPWLREVVRHHVHAILPDGATAYATGDWSSRPTYMPSRALDVIAMVLPAEDRIAAEARFLARELRQRRDDWSWIRLLADEPTAKVEDPRKGKLSYLARGTGLVLARSDWSDKATFVALQSGPSIEEADHQHADQGHFEIIRGSDPLLVRVADYGAFATINHNSILVDDGGRSLDYSPNQGVFGSDSTIVRYVDNDDYVYAEADFTDAYRPAKLQWGKKRSVLRAERALVFVRPSTVVLYDRVGLDDPSFQVTWAAHSLVSPTVSGSDVTVRKGQSALALKALLPEGAEIGIVAEPQKQEGRPHAYKVNQTYAPSFRIELRAKPAAEVRFLTVAQTGGRDFSATSVERIEGKDVDGAQVGKTAVVFPRSGVASKATSSKWEMKPAEKLIVIGLVPGARYRIRGKAIQSGCAVEVQPGGAKVADEGGTLLVRMEACIVR